MSYFGRPPQSCDQAGSGILTIRQQQMLRLLRRTAHVPGWPSQEAVAASHRPRLHAAQEVVIVERQVDQSSILRKTIRGRKKSI